MGYGGEGYRQLLLHNAATVILTAGAGKKAARAIHEDFSADREVAAARLANARV